MIKLIDPVCGSLCRNEVFLNINLGVCQGYVVYKHNSLSPIQFNIYKEDLVIECKLKANTRINLKNKTYLKSVIFIDYQVTIQQSEHVLKDQCFKDRCFKLCKSVYNWHDNLCTEDRHHDFWVRGKYQYKQK